MTDLGALRVRGTPELLRDLKERDENRMDSRKLTDYAVAHGVELPEFYTPDQLIGMAYTEEGQEIGLIWEDPDDLERSDPPRPPVTDPR
jgi:hypothetical protein